MYQHFRQLSKASLYKYVHYPVKDAWTASTSGCQHLCVRALFVPIFRIKPGASHIPGKQSTTWFLDTGSLYVAQIDCSSQCWPSTCHCWVECDLECTPYTWKRSSFALHVTSHSSWHVSRSRADESGDIEKLPNPINIFPRCVPPSQTELKKRSFATQR